jgi:hypothetical protein
VDIYRSQRPCFLEFILTEVSLSPDSTCNLLQPNFTAASPSSLVLRGSGTAPYVLNPLSAAFSPIIGVKLNYKITVLALLTGISYLVPPPHPPIPAALFHTILLICNCT